MVHSVMAIPHTAKTKRERQESSHQKSSSDTLFSQILDDATKDLEETTRECLNVVYGPNCKLQTFQYQSKEYRY